MSKYTYIARIKILVQKCFQETTHIYLINDRNNVVVRTQIQIVATVASASRFENVEITF